MGQVVKERFINIDIAKALAVFGVIATHSINYIGTIHANVAQGKSVWLLLFLANAVTFCVPIFLLATGYLMRKKQLSKKYYQKIIGVLFVYLVTSVVYQIFINLSSGTPNTIMDIARSIINIEGSPYSWYVRMYIGLFLLIPFLNILWAGLKTKKAKSILCITLIILTVLPHFEFKGFHVIEYWKELWPLTFYFLGAYIKEFNFKMILQKKIILLILGFGWSCAATIYSISINQGNVLGGYAVWWSNPWTILYSTMLFSIIVGCKIKLPKAIASAISKIAALTLGTYLISAVFDELIYVNILGFGNYPTRDFYYLIATTPIIFLLSLLSAHIIDLSWRGIVHLSSRKKLSPSKSD
ncbi:MAG: acyltransferase [Candidatus Saccharimonadales bacterium]